MPLLPFPPGCVAGVLQRRVKRFFIEFTLNGRDCLAHTNNSGSMLGLLRPGSPVWVSPALTTGRRLPYTLELVCLPGSAPGETATAALPAARDGGAAAPDAPEATAEEERGSRFPEGLLVGVNTLTPNRLLKAAFMTGRLPWAAGYTDFKAEAGRGASRLDALLTGPDLPPLWVECKNVTMVEDGVAAFPDAPTERGRKHLREMADIARCGGRAVFFYCVQRTDARCFGPADYVDAAYAELYYECLAAGVEVHPHPAPADAAGIDLGPELPLAVRR